MKQQHHTIEIFSADCPLCMYITDDIEIGKCKSCNQIINNVNEMANELKLKMKEYGIKAVPTTIIDGNIKVVGIPDFSWVCSDELYMKLKKDHSINKKI